MAPSPCCIHRRGRHRGPYCVIAFAMPAAAQVAGDDSECAALGRFEAALAVEFNEHLAAAHSIEGRLWLLYGSPDGTWTVARANPDTWMVCAIDYGTGWTGAEDAFHPAGRPCCSSANGSSSKPMS